jgi:cell division protein YceG involved in septum cleavage
MSSSRTADSRKVNNGYSSGGKNTRKQKKRTEDVVNIGLKRSTGFAFSLLINIIILFLVVKLFTFAFNFSYSVFGDVRFDPGSTTYKVVEIPVDASTLEIGAALEDAGIIEDKYVFWVRVKIKGYGSKIYSGKYGLSASMNVDEILTIICHLDDDEED